MPIRCRATLWRRLVLAEGVELHVAGNVRLPPPGRLNELAGLVPHATSRRPMTPPTIERRVMPDQLAPARAGLYTREAAPVPLAGVAIDAELSTIGARVSVSQRYVNRESAPIEAVYLFPLDEGAAVCGFEAVDRRHAGDWRSEGA